MQEIILNLFPFKFYLTWNERGELLKLKINFSSEMNPYVINIKNSKILKWAKKFYKAFLDYWHFKESCVKIPHQLNLSKFEKKVLKETLNLKIGEYITYKELAQKINSPLAYRAVGKALSKNPLPLIYPCHRVIGKNGLTGYSQGLLLKQFFLYRELKII